MTEIEVVQRAKQGDRGALSELYTAYYKKVYYLALKMTDNREDAEDVTQETFVAAFKALPNLVNDAAMEKWLMQIAANRSRNCIGQHRFTTELPEDFAEYEPDPDEAILPEHVLQEAAKRQIILNLVKELPDAQRECVMLFYYSGMSVKEIAQSLGVSEGTVKSRLNYARQKIKDAVLETEQRDEIRLHSFMPLALLFIKDLEEVSAGISIPALTLEVTAVAAATGTAAATGAAVASSVAGTAVKAGLFAAAKAKIIAGVAAAAILAGGATVVATQTDVFTDVFRGGETASSAEDSTEREDEDTEREEDVEREENAEREEDNENPSGSGLGSLLEKFDPKAQAAALLQDIPYYGDTEKCTMTAEQAHAYAQLIVDGLTGTFEGYTGYGWPAEEGPVYWDEPYGVCGYSGIYDTNRAHVILGDFAADGNPYLYVFSSLVDSSYEIFGWNGMTAQRVFGAECYQGRQYSDLASDYTDGTVSAYTGGSMGASSRGGETYAFENGDVYMSYSWEQTWDDRIERWHVIENGVDTLYTQEEFMAQYVEGEYTPPVWNMSYAPLNDVTASPATLREMLAVLNEYASILSGGKIAPVTVPEMTPMAKAMLNVINSYERDEYTNAVLQDMNDDGIPELIVGDYKNMATCDVYTWENDALSKESMGGGMTERIALIRNVHTGEYGILTEGSTDTYFFNYHYASGTISGSEEYWEGNNGEWESYYYGAGHEPITKEEYDAILEQNRYTAICEITSWNTSENQFSQTVAAIRSMTQ